MLAAGREWRDNPLTSRVNRCLWGAAWPAVLALLVAATVAADRELPPFSSLIGFAPPLTALAFIPDLVRELVYSSPAFFAFVVVWRVHRLRSSNPARWSDRTSVEDFGGRFFDAAALPVAVAALALAAGIQVAAVALGSGPADVAVDVSAWSIAEGSSRFARALVIVALVTGILGVYRRVSAGFGKLLGAGFVVWGGHLGIAFTVPFMTSWLSYLPVIGRYAPERSATWAHLLFDLAVVCSAWIAAREKWLSAPLWTDAPAPSEPPPPPPPAPPPPPSKG